MNQPSNKQTSKPWFQMLIEIPDGYFYAFLIACWFMFVALIIFGEDRCGLGGVTLSASSVADSEAVLTSDISRFEGSIVNVGCGFGLSQPTQTFKQPGAIGSRSSMIATCGWIAASLTPVDGDKLPEAADTRNPSRFDSCQVAPI